MERKDTLFSRHKIKDLARDLPTQYKELEEKFNKMLKDFNNIPDYIDYLSMVVDAKLKGKEIEDNITIELHEQLESNLIALIKIASEKSDLNEAARTRKATIKTGGVKKKIEEQLPEETLKKMISDLTENYKKFNDYMLPKFSQSIVNKNVSESSQVNLETYSYNKKFVETKLDIQGKEMRDLFSSVLLERDKLVKVVVLVNKLMNNLHNADKMLNEKQIDQKSDYKQSI